MSATQDDLNDFNQFATEKLKVGVIESLEELLYQWRIARDRNDVNAAIRRGIADVDAGRTRPLDEFWDEFTREHQVTREA